MDSASPKPMPAKTAPRERMARPKAAGLTRFEVRGLDADRALIRSLARRLAEEGPKAARRPAWSRAGRRVRGGIDLTKTRHPGRDIDL